MKFYLEIACENAAFYNGDDEFDPATELHRILTLVTRQVEAGVPIGGIPIRLRDANGNVVGQYELY